MKRCFLFKILLWNDDESRSFFEINNYRVKRHVKLWNTSNVLEYKEFIQIIAGNSVNEVQELLFNNKNQESGSRDRR
jgi:hypothetical protein